MNLNDITLFGQPYMLYVALLGVAVVGLKMVELPKKVGMVVAVILIVVILSLLGYVMYQAYITAKV